MKFEELEFKRFNEGYNCSLELENGLKVSITCGGRAYSTPRELVRLDEYVSFEVGILDKDREFITRDVIKGTKYDVEDDVLGWMGKEEIEEIIDICEAYQPVSEEEFDTTFSFDPKDARVEASDVLENHNIETQGLGEILMELRRRGYSGKLKKTIVEEIEV